MLYFSSEAKMEAVQQSEQKRRQHIVGGCQRCPKNGGEMSVLRFNILPSSHGDIVFLALHRTDNGTVFVNVL